MPVSATSAAELREAMARLLAGELLHTDGALNQENVALERSRSHDRRKFPRVLPASDEWALRPRPHFGPSPMQIWPTFWKTR